MKTKNNSIHLLALVAASVCTLAAARADTIALATTGGTVTSVNGYTTGYTFTLTAPVQVTQLGFYDSFADGLSTTVPVTIWNNAGVVQASATVPGGTSAGEMSQYLYVKLATPVTLAVGTYTLGAYTSSSVDQIQYNVTTVSPATGLTYGAPRAVNGNAYPTGDAFGEVTGYFGPNFQFASGVPEPSTWALLGLGVAGAGVVTLRRRSVRA